jgi:putative SOS response-associated peptidase YedK
LVERRWNSPSFCTARSGRYQDNISHVDDGVQLDLPAVYPDTMTPIIRLADNGARNLTMMR